MISVLEVAVWLPARDQVLEQLAAADGSSMQQATSMK
jgi:hypothetical protein